MVLPSPRAMRVVNIEPEIPTPNTMPKFRAVARIPAAIPWRCRGAAPIKALLFGDMNVPVPNPNTPSENTIDRTDESGPSWDSKIKPAVSTAIPDMVNQRVPSRSDNVPLSGAMIAMITG